MRKQDSFNLFAENNVMLLDKYYKNKTSRIGFYKI